MSTITIAQKIKFYRKRMGYTQTELGEKLGVMKNAVSKWETERVTAIPTQKLFDMAKIFHISLSELIDDDSVICRQDPFAERTALLEFLKDINMYISPAYDEAEACLSDSIINKVWSGYNPVLAEEYSLSEDRVNESTELIIRFCRVLFGPEDYADTRVILSGLLDLPPDAVRMLAAQMRIMTK